MTKETCGRVQAKVKAASKKQNNPTSDVIKGIIGVAALGEAAAGAAQVIKADMVQSGQAEWGSYPARVEPKPGVCRYISSCNKPTTGYSDYCSDCEALACYASNHKPAPTECVVM